MPIEVHQWQAGNLELVVPSFSEGDQLLNISSLWPDSKSQPHIQQSASIPSNHYFLLFIVRDPSKS